MDWRKKNFIHKPKFFFKNCINKPGKEVTPENACVSVCFGFSWGRGYFLHISWYGAVFCICYENAVDNTMLRDCFHYCWAELTQPQSLFCSTSCPTSEAAQEVMREKSWGSWPKGYSRLYDVMLRIWIWGKKKEGEEGDIWSDGIFLPESLLHVMDPCFPGHRWTLTCWWELVHEFLILFACPAFPLPFKLFLSQSTSFLIFTILILFSIPLQVLSESFCGVKLLARIKPWHCGKQKK